MVEKDNTLAALEEALKNAHRGGFPKGGCIVTPDVPPCDGSYTEPWESTEAVHGPLYLSWWSTKVFRQDLHERHPLGLPDTLAGL